jgi:hypothetical protein
MHLRMHELRIKLKKIRWNNFSALFFLWYNIGEKYESKHQINSENLLATP